MDANPENPRSVDQKVAGRCERIWSQVLALPPLLARQGAVVASWRVWQGRRLGPYFRLAYREAGRQRSIYLGRSEELAGRVRRLLEQLRDPPQQRRQCRQLIAAVRRAFPLPSCRARNRGMLPRPAT